MRTEMAQAATFSGVGLHTGEQVRVRVSAAAFGEGLRLIRTDRSPPVSLKANAGVASGADRCTRVGSRKDGVLTVEHLLAALAALGLWDATVEVDGPEVPILDGSAEPFVDGLRHLVGPPPSPPWVPPQLELQLGPSQYTVVPAPNLRLSVTFSYDHRLVGEQHASMVVDQHTFIRELAPARTFGRADEADELRQRGLARGARTDNCIVLGVDGPLGTSLRWRDEFVRHKMVDILGDLALLGCPLSAHVVAKQPTHRGNVALAQLLAEHHQRAKDAA